MNTKKLLGKRIKELLKRKGVTQEKLAEMIGVEPPAISNIIRGNNYPLFINLEKIAKILDVEMYQLLDFSHHNSKNDLKAKIIKALNENPDKLQDIYKIVMALTK